MPVSLDPTQAFFCSLSNQRRFHLFKKAVAQNLLHDYDSRRSLIQLSFWQKICHALV